MVLGCPWGVEVLLGTALCDGGYRWRFALCGVWLWSACLQEHAFGLWAFFVARDEAKTRKRVFLFDSIDVTDSPMSLSRARRMIVGGR